MAPVLDIWNREGAADVSTSDSTIILLIGELGTQHSRTVPDHLWATRDPPPISRARQAACRAAERGRSRV